MDSIKATIALLEGRTDQRQAEIDVSMQRSTVARKAAEVAAKFEALDLGPSGWKTFTQKLEIDIGNIQSVYVKALNHASEFSDPDASEVWPVKSEKAAADAIERARQLSDALIEDAEQIKFLASAADDLLSLTSAIYDLIELNKKLPADSELLKK